MTGHQPEHPPFFFHCFKNQQIFLDIISRDKIPCHNRVADGIKQMICNAGGENPESSHQAVVWVTVWSPPVQRSPLSNSTNLVLLFWREHHVLSLCSVLHRFINFTQRILTLTKHNTGTMSGEQETGEAQKVLVDNRLICRICSI